MPNLIELLQRTGLKPADKLVLLVLALHADRDGRVSPLNMSRIAELASVSVPTARRAVAALGRERLVDVEQRSGSVTRYRVRPMCPRAGVH
jgi:DNA-binding MarR family transcriptional regulator